MARCKEFDVDQALERAMQLFWERGYETTSMRDLQEHMGIGRQSLYDTFGDKRQLFLAALTRYNASSASRVRSALMDDDASLAALRQWFDDLVVFLTPRGSRPGCLLANSIVELGTDDEEVASTCRAGERNLLRGLRAAVSRAIERGELPSTCVDGAADAAMAAEEVATFLVVQTYGLTVLAKGGASRKRLEQTVDRAFAALGIVVD